MNSRFFTSGIDEATMQAIEASKQFCLSHFECKDCPLHDGEGFELVEGIRTTCEQ